MGEPPVGPKDMVEWVGSASVPPSERFLAPGAPAKGSVWIVEAVGIWCGRIPWVRLVGAPVPGRSPGWHALCVRPISRRADFETILAQLKTPVPVPEHETA